MMRDDEYNSQNMRRSRREHGWIELFPLLFLLIFVFTQSVAGLIASLAIIFLLEVFIAAAAPGRSNTPSNLPTRHSVPVYRPPVETPYEQGYQGVWNVPQLLETNAPKEASQAEMTSESSRGEQPQLDYPQELPPMRS